MMTYLDDFSFFLFILFTCRLTPLTLRLRLGLPRLLVFGLQ
jgi:hypothetical protein